MEKSQYIMKMAVDLNDWFDIVNDINNDDINKEIVLHLLGSSLHLQSIC